MVAKGKFGSEMVPEAALWRTLPEPFDDHMRRDLDRLVELTVLLRTPSTQHKDRQVGLNSELSPEIQNLINRRVTQFWTDIIAQSAEE